MKIINAYVNTTRIHWLVEKLQEVGIREIMVMEFFKMTSQISRLSCFCQDHQIDEVRTIVHKFGTIGPPPDHFINVTDFDPTTLSDMPLGKRMSLLEG